jgi:hypothetical protein
MKPKNIILLGIILTLIGFITPRIVHSFSLGIGTILVFCSVLGLLMLIVGAMRLSRARKTESDV